MDDVRDRLRRATVRLELLRERNAAQRDALTRALGQMADRSTTALDGLDPAEALTDPAVQRRARYGLVERARARRASA